MLLYKCFRFSEFMDQMFLTVRGVVQGVLLGLRSVLTLSSFMSSHDQDKELGEVFPHPPRFFSSVLI